jgi:hypothetical protein
MKWINGLHPCSKYPDVKIFHASLLSCQDDFERVEADDGYIRECPFRAKLYGTKGHVSEAEAAQIFFVADIIFLANNLINSPICEDRLICESVLFLRGK